MTAALNMGEPSPIHFQITGSNLQTAQQIAQLVGRRAKQIDGTADVRIAQRMDYPVLNIEMDRILAAHQGVTVDDAMKNVVSATNSSINFEPAFWIDPSNGNHYFMGVQYFEEDINSIDTLRYIPVTGDGSTRPVPLENFAEIHQTTGPAVINHRNITRATDVYVNVLPGYDIGSVVEAIERRLEDDLRLKLVPEQTERGQSYAVSGPDYQGKGYTVEMQGEVRSMRESFVQFTEGLMIAAVLIFLAMVALLRSFATPWVVMVTIPLGLVGVAVALWATGTNLNIQSFMGIIMMMGIVVEYSIVLLDFADRRVREGRSPEEAVYEAAMVRFRPILMTSVTTILALLPMAVGFAGGDADQPLALTIVGGVVAATLLPKFVVPCFYAILKRPGARTVETAMS